MPPVFRYKIQPLEINVGEPAKFECEIEEDAQNVNFKWFKSGTEIRQSEKYRIISHHHSSSMEVMNTGSGDSAEFSCKATNQHGSEKCSAYLTVSRKSMFNLFLRAAVLAVFGWVDTVVVQLC